MPLRHANTPANSPAIASSPEVDVCLTPVDKRWVEFSAGEAGHREGCSEHQDQNGEGQSTGPNHDNSAHLPPSRVNDCGRLRDQQ